jgi:unsaturated chondroitin disaccharide hydrolase
MTQTANAPSSVLHAALELAQKQVRLNSETFLYNFPENNTTKNLYTLRQPRKDHLVGGNSGWTTSFWTGQLWLSYEASFDTDFRRSAEIHLMSFKERLERRVDVGHHDIGFLYSLSAVAQHTVTGNQQARAVGLRAADILLERWLPGHRVL